jgi:hypothetical protein
MNPAGGCPADFDLWLDRVLIGNKMRVYNLSGRVIVDIYIKYKFENLHLYYMYLHRGIRDFPTYVPMYVRTHLHMYVGIHVLIYVGSHVLVYVRTYAAV